MVSARTELGDDPFLVPRDAGEVAADTVMRTFILDTAPPAAIFRQEGGSYTLVVPSRLGARLLTVPAANEADFTFHGNAGAGGERLADFVAAAVAESAADHVRLPLLSEAQAVWLEHRMAARLPDWIWSASLAAVAPLASGTMRQTGRLRRAAARAKRDGLGLRLHAIDRSTGSAGAPRQTMGAGEPRQCLLPDAGHVAVRGLRGACHGAYWRRSPDLGATGHPRNRNASLLLFGQRHGSREGLWNRGARRVVEPLRG